MRRLDLHTGYMSKTTHLQGCFLWKKCGNAQWWDSNFLGTGSLYLGDCPLTWRRNTQIQMYWLWKWLESYNNCTFSTWKDKFSFNLLFWIPISFRAFHDYARGGTPFLASADGPSLIFYHSDFWITFLLWNTELPWNFSLCWNIFYLSGLLSNLCLPWKTECALNSPYWMYCLSFRILNNLRLPWKTETALEFFTVLKYFLSLRIFEKLWLALKTEFALNFSSRGGGRHPASYATEYTGRYLALPMQKEKHNWNWSVKYFILRTRLSKISLFGIVLKRLELPVFFNCLAQTFPTHKHMDVWRGAGIWKFQQKMLFSQFRVVKTKFHHFWPPVEKLLDKSTSGPPWKKSFRRPCTQVCKMTPFSWKIVLYYTIWQHCSTTPMR